MPVKSLVRGLKREREEPKHSCHSTGSQKVLPSRGGSTLSPELALKAVGRGQLREDEDG